MSSADVLALIIWGSGAAGMASALDDIDKLDGRDTGGLWYFLTKILFCLGWPIFVPAAFVHRELSRSKLGSEES